MAVEQRKGDELQKEPRGGISRVATLQVEVRKQRSLACGSSLGWGAQGEFMQCAGVYSMIFFSCQG